MIGYDRIIATLDQLTTEIVVATRNWLSTVLSECDLISLLFEVHWPFSSIKQLNWKSAALGQYINETTVWP